MRLPRRSSDRCGLNCRHLIDLRQERFMKRLAVVAIALAAAACAGGQNDGTDTAAPAAGAVEAAAPATDSAIKADSAARADSIAKADSAAKAAAKTKTP
jgi:hypothetical protein